MHALKTALVLAVVLLFAQESPRVSTLADLKIQTVMNTERLNRLDNSQAELAGQTREIYEHVYRLERNQAVAQEDTSFLKYVLGGIAGIASACLSQLIFFWLKKQRV